ncbi:MAG: hypothetical protein M9899_01505 [Bdellovibrionaceae bacterium]|nr:hypothetical protein [Pseudobdellovibrionaceae bacterium]
MGSRIRLHWVLIGLVVVLFLSAIALKIFKNRLDAQNTFHSERTQEQIIKELSQSVPERLEREGKGYLLSKNEGTAYLSIFKKEAEMELWLPQQEQRTRLKFLFRSEGHGLRMKVTDSSFPEGIYKVQNVGWDRDAGYFIQLDYPSAQALKDQKIKAETFRYDAILITKTPIFYSFILLDDETLETLVYLLLKWGYDDVRVASFPSRPPLKMAIDGTMTLAEIYTELTELYGQMTGELHGSQ